MTSVARVEQAVVLIKDRLRQLAERGRAGAKGAASAQRPDRGDALQPLRELLRLGQIDEQELRRAFVRTLLAEALGEELVGSIEFQSVADQVAHILQRSEVGSALMTRALAEIG